MNDSKVCTKCKVEKPRDCFRSYKAMRDGKRSTCKECEATYNAAYSEKARPIRNARAIAWNAANKHWKRVYHSNRRAVLCGVEGVLVLDEWIAKLESYAGFCHYCGEYFGDALEIEHQIPISRGGPNSLENVVPACSFCNTQKKDKTHEEYKAWLDARKKLQPSLW